MLSGIGFCYAVSLVLRLFATAPCRTEIEVPLKRFDTLCKVIQIMYLRFSFKAFLRHTHSSSGRLGLVCPCLLNICVGEQAGRSIHTRKSVIKAEKN